MVVGNGLAFERRSFRNACARRSTRSHDQCRRTRKLEWNPLVTDNTRSRQPAIGTYIARIGTGVFGKMRRAARSAQNPRKGERAEMTASTGAVVKSRKAFRAPTDIGRLSWSRYVKEPDRTGGAEAEFQKWRRCDRPTGVADRLPEKSRQSTNHSPLVRPGTNGAVGGGDSARNVSLSAMAYDENMGTTFHRPQNRRERNV